MKTTPFTLLFTIILFISCTGSNNAIIIKADSDLEKRCQPSGVNISLENDDAFPYFRMTSDSVSDDPFIMISLSDLLCSEIHYIAVKTRVGSCIKGDLMQITCICDSCDAVTVSSTGNFNGKWEYYAFDLTSHPELRGNLLKIRYDFIDRMKKGYVVDFAEICFFQSLDQMYNYCKGTPTKPVTYDLTDYTLSTGPGVMEQSAEAIEYLKDVWKSVYGLELKSGNSDFHRIDVLLEGDALDWSVYLDSEGTVKLSGGSQSAINQAVMAFLTYICTADNTRPIATERMNYSYNMTDNSTLLKYIPSNKVKLIPSDAEGNLMTPEWFGSLVMVEICPVKASIGGNLPQCRELVDFYASVGVNAIWLTPIYDSRTGCNGYANNGPHTVDPAFTGTDDMQKGWEVVHDFVSYAHSKGIYVFLDVVTWGAMRSSLLVKEHPDWFLGDAWGHRAFNWTNNELRDWFVNTMVDDIVKTDADGLRCDCEPYYTGYDIFGSIRKKLAEKGKFVAMISEDGSTRRSTYECEQDGVLKYSAMDRVQLYRNNPVNFFTEGFLDIVTSVKTGEGLGISHGQSNPLWRGTSKYYTNCITNHDYHWRNVCGNRLKIGYAAILAPFIPIWYMGDEFLIDTTKDASALYDLDIDYSEAQKPENAFFLEDVRKMIRIRRTYKDIFENWPMNHRDCKICEVGVEGLGTLQCYARYAGNRAILVIANNSAGSHIGKVTIPFEECGLSDYKQYRITDLMTGRLLLDGSSDNVSPFTVTVAENYMAIYLVEGIN